MAKPTYKYIMAHHSLSKDGITRDWDAIRRYHMSWRYLGTIISEDYAKKLISKNQKGVLRPWQDIGYHVGCEYVDDKYVIVEGRPYAVGGAHCPEGGMNLLSIGFCLVGNFDISPPKTEQLIVAGQKMLDLAKEYNMGEPSEWLKYHCEYATYKSCPGKLFPKKEKMIEFLGELKNGFINYKSAFSFT